MSASGAGAIELPVRPEEQPLRRPGRHLRPVDKRGKRRSPAVPIVVGAGIVVVALFALAAMHALLINRQIQLDDLRQETAAEAEEVRRLRLQVAELEAPDRILDVARTRLDMVDPVEVGYLLPAGVDAGQSEPVRVAPAEPAPPQPEGSTEEAPVLDAAPETGSPEQIEVEETLESGGEPGEAAEDTGDGAGDPADQAGDGAPEAGAEGGPEESSG